MMARWDFPDDWLVGLVLPDVATFSGAEELSFFKSNTPVPADQVLDTMASMYHGVLPAFAMADMSLLKSALEKVHSVGLKHAELLAQSSRTIEAFRTLQTLPKVAVGLSSLGPLLYCVFEKSDYECRQSLDAILEQLGAEYLGSFPGCNSGFTTEAI
jgi:beta-ribofuranosylaminobenzene 5'-phosphate synthase